MPSDHFSHLTISGWSERFIDLSNHGNTDAGLAFSFVENYIYNLLRNSNHKFILKFTYAGRATSLLLFQPLL